MTQPTSGPAFLRNLVVVSSGVAVVAGVVYYLHRIKAWPFVEIDQSEPTTSNDASTKSNSTHARQPVVLENQEPLITPVAIVIGANPPDSSIASENRIASEIVHTATLIGNHLEPGEVSENEADSEEEEEEMGQGGSAASPEIVHYTKPLKDSPGAKTGSDSSPECRITVNPVQNASLVPNPKAKEPASPFQHTNGYDIRTGSVSPPPSKLKKHSGAIKISLLDRVQGFSAAEYEEGTESMLCELYAHSRVVSAKEARVLGMLLERADEDRLLKTLTVISNLAAFTANQDLLRENGALASLAELASESRMSSLTTPQQIMLVQAIANLAVNVENQKILQASCIQSLVDRLSHPRANELTKITCLRALVNLTVLGTPDTPVGVLVDALPVVCKRVTQKDSTGCINSLKLLVNLSLMPDALLLILSRKDPENLLELLEPPVSPEVLLRVLALVINLAEAVETLGLTETDLLPLDSDSQLPNSSPNLYQKLFGSFEARHYLLFKLQTLQHHEHSELREKATRAVNHVRGIHNSVNN